MKTIGNNDSLQLKQRLADKLNLPIEVIQEIQTITETTSGLPITHLTIMYGKSEPITYQVDGRADSLADEQLQILRANIKNDLKKNPLTRNIYRIFGLWITFAGLYGMTSVCPFCGQAGCVVGIAGAGVAGGVFTLLFHNWRHFFRAVIKKLKKLMR